MSNQIERRFLLKNQKIEARETKNGKKQIEGYAIKWETLSQEIGYFYKFREQFSKNAFREYLEEGNDVKSLIHHDSSKVLARLKYNTIELEEDETGLNYLVDLPNNTLGNDLFESVYRGDIDGVSVGFIKLIDEWDESDENNVIRTIRKAKLPEFSFTAFPAYLSTTADVRSNNNNIYEPYKNYCINRFKRNLDNFKRFDEIQKLK